MKKIIIIFFAFLLTGCATNMIPAQYQAQNTQQFEATSNFGEVSYLPNENGKVESNQIQSQGIVKILLSENIESFVRRGNIMEFQHSGGNVSNDSNTKIVIDVERFFVGDLGTRTRWEYEATYKIFKNDELAHTKEVVLEPVRMGKGGEASDYTPVVTNMIRKGYEAFISDSKVQSILSE